MKSSINYLLAIASATTSSLAAPFNVTSRLVDAPAVPPEQSNLAGHYAGRWEGQCGFKNYKPSNGIQGAAIAGRFWYNAGYCGACVGVRDTTSGREVVAMVVDQCPTCTPDVNLFDQAWTNLAPLSQNTLQADWGITSCNHREPIIIEFNNGASEWWIGLQVLNANFPVFDVYARKNTRSGEGEQWKKLSGQSYNSFVGEGGLGPVVDLRVECSNQRSVVLDGVKVQGSQRVWAKENC